MLVLKRGKDFSFQCSALLFTVAPSCLNISPYLELRCRMNTLKTKATEFFQVIKVTYFVLCKWSTLSKPRTWFYNSLPKIQLQIIFWSVNTFFSHPCFKQAVSDMLGHNSSTGCGCELSKHLAYLTLCSIVFTWRLGGGE